MSRPGCALLFAAALTSSAGCRPLLGIEETELDPAACRLVTQRIFFADKPADDTEVQVGALTEARLRELAGDLGVVLDADRGHALTEMRDCPREPAVARARYVPSDEMQTPFATQGAGLRLGDTSGIEGVTGVFNLLAPEEYEVTAFPDELEVESSQGDVVVRAGELSRIALVPNSEVMVTPPAEDEWTCVGSVEEPQPTGDRITFSVEVRSATTFVADGPGLEGLRVIVCRDEAANCPADAPVAPADEAFTDAAGRALLQVSVDDGLFDGHLVVSGRDPRCAL